MKNRVLLIIPLCFLAMLRASAQDVQIPFDDAGRIMTISWEIESSTRLFPAVDDFQEARMFMAADSSLFVEIIQRSNRRIRIEITWEDRLRMQVQLNIALKKSRPDLILDQSGRSSLLWGSTLWSLSYYGTALRIALFGDSYSSFALAFPYLFGGTGGYLIPALLTSSSRVTDGAAMLSLSGMFQGGIHGHMLTSVIQGSDYDERIGFGMSVFLGVVETIAGFHYAHADNINEGNASVMAVTGFYGMFAGSMIGVAAFEDGVFDNGGRTFSAFGLAGATAGWVVGKLLTDSRSYTSGNASVYAVSGLIGTYLPIAFVSAFEPDVSAQVLTSILAAGTIGGLIVGDQIVYNRRLSGAQGTTATLATLGGAMIGIGSGILIGTDKAIILAPAIGSAAGLGLSLLSMEDMPLGLGSNVNFQVNPFALAASSVNFPHAIGGMPLFMLNWKL